MEVALHPNQEKGSSQSDSLYRKIKNLGMKRRNLDKK